MRPEPKRCTAAALTSSAAAAGIEVVRVVGAAMLMHFPVLLTAPAFLVKDRVLSLLNYLAQANPSKFIKF